LRLSAFRAALTSPDLPVSRKTMRPESASAFRRPSTRLWRKEKSPRARVIPAPSYRTDPFSILTSPKGRPPAGEDSCGIHEKSAISNDGSFSETTTKGSCAINLTMETEILMRGILRKVPFFSTDTSERVIEAGNRKPAEPIFTAKPDDAAIRSIFARSLSDSTEKKKNGAAAATRTARKIFFFTGYCFFPSP